MSEQEEELYPRLMRLGVRIVRDEPQAPPGVDGRELARVFAGMGLLGAWERWACGITVSNNGIYPWDVEAFLSGKENDD